MFSRVDGYFISVVAYSDFSITHTLDPLPPGTNVYANISLSHLNTWFRGQDMDPTFVSSAFIESYTRYNPDGTQSAPLTPPNYAQNAIWIENCATIKFTLRGKRIDAIAQINVFAA